MSRSRAFCLTVNNYTDDDVMNWIDCSARYIVFGFEVGENGTPHIQGYIYFHDARTIKSVSKDFPRAHILIAKGTPEQNFDYCSEDGEFYEFGDMPDQGRAKWDKIKEVMKDPKSNPHLFQQYYKTYRLIKSMTPKTHERKLILLNYDHRFDFASKCSSVVFLDSFFDKWNNEAVVIYSNCSLYSIESRIEEWICGYPPTYKRGYEVFKFDPECIAIVCNCIEDYDRYKKLYEKYLTL